MLMGKRAAICCKENLREKLQNVQFACHTSGAAAFWSRLARKNFQIGRLSFSRRYQLFFGYIAGTTPNFSGILSARAEKHFKPLRFGSGPRAEAMLFRHLRPEVRAARARRVSFAGQMNERSHIRYYVYKPHYCCEHGFHSVRSTFDLRSPINS